MGGTRIITVAPIYTRTSALVVMLPRKKHGYNWRARQKQPKSVKKAREKHVEAVGNILYNKEVEYATLEDTNALVLPAKRKRSRQDEDGEAPKKKKLSSSQRKRLQKIVEAKERKAKVNF